MKWRSPKSDRVDFENAYQMAIRRRTMITREGAYYLFVLGFVLTGAVLREINLMLVLAGMMIGPLLVNWRVSRRMTRGLAVIRRVPESTQACRPVTVQFTVTSESRAATLAIEDRITRNTASDSDVWAREIDDRRSSAARGGALVADCRPDSPATASYRVRFDQRGEYQLGPLSVSTAFPFGMIRTTVRFEREDKVLVYPRIGRLTSRWTALLDESNMGAQRRPRQGPAEGEFYALRNWRSGDSRRHIHWRTSARRGALMVRQFERLHGRNLTILLDPWQPADPRIEQLEAVEAAVSFAATLINDACRRGGAHLVLSVIGDQTGALHAESSAFLEREAMRRLAIVLPHHETSLDSAVSEVIGHSTADAALVLVTTRDAKIPAPRTWKPGDERVRQKLMDRMVTVRADRGEINDLIEFEIPIERRRKPAAEIERGMSVPA
jgi:uncharacterized protein (DUF58 family)